MRGGRRISYHHVQNLYDGRGEGTRASLPDFISGPTALVQRIVGSDAMTTARTHKHWASVTVGASADAEA